jgi:hypothetical protein
MLILEYLALLAVPLLIFSLISWSGMNGSIKRAARNIGDVKAHINFLTQCSKINIVPSGFRSKPIIHTKKSEYLEDRFAKIRMNEQLNFLHAKLFNLQIRSEFYRDANPGLNEEFWDEIESLTKQTYNTRRENQAPKLQRLKQKELNGKRGFVCKLDAVLNLSSRHLSNEETEVLALGFNFRPSLPDLPIKDYIVATESYIKRANLDDTAGANIRNAVIKEIERMKHKNLQKPQKSNLSPAQWQAVKSLKEDQSIIIIPADKGNKTVILDREAYLDKLNDRVKDHVPIDFDAALHLEKSLNATIQNITNTDVKITKKNNHPLILDRSSLKRFKSDNAIMPELGGRMKAHKPGYPLREISNAVGAPGHELAKSLNRVFSPYVGNTKTYLRNGEHFIQILNSGRFNAGFRISLDAVALYPNIMVDQAFEILEQKLKEDKKLSERTNLSKPELLQLSKLCIKNPSFQCELGRFQQTDGAPMGGPLSRLLADLVLEDRESKIRKDRNWRHKWD